MKTDIPLVSILLPCYNVAEFVERAIRSILSQSYSNLEIWIIDDASTDNTLQKIEAFKDERIKVITYKENTQKVGAVNEVLQKVNGDYIAFQDADDWSESTRIERQLEQFSNDSSLGVCFTNYRYIGKKVIIPDRIALTNEELKSEFLNYGKKNNLNISATICGTMMISLEALKSTGGYNPYFAGRVAEDIHWIYRILKQFNAITVKDVLYNYSYREGSLTQTQTAGKNAKYAYSWQLLSKIIYKDIHEGIDVFSPANSDILKKLELEACEDALIESLQLLNATRALYKNSMSFKIGKFALTPWRIVRSKIMRYKKKS